MQGVYAVLVYGYDMVVHLECIRVVFRCKMHGCVAYGHRMRIDIYSGAVCRCRECECNESVSEIWLILTFVSDTYIVCYWKVMRDT